MALIPTEACGIPGRMMRLHFSLHLEEQRAEQQRSLCKVTEQESLQELSVSTPVPHASPLHLPGRRASTWLIRINRNQTWGILPLRMQYKTHSFDQMEKSSPWRLGIGKKIPSFFFFFPRSKKMGPMRFFLHFVLIHWFSFRPS